MTAGGGNLIGAEVIRNKRSAQWAVASIEDAEERPPLSPSSNIPALPAEMIRSMSPSSFPPFRPAPVTDAGFLRKRKRLIRIDQPQYLRNNTKQKLIRQPMVIIPVYIHT